MKWWYSSLDIILCLSISFSKLPSLLSLLSGNILTSENHNCLKFKNYCLKLLHKIKLKAICHPPKKRASLPPNKFGDEHFCLLLASLNLCHNVLHSLVVLYRSFRDHPSHLNLLHRNINKHIILLLWSHLKI